MQPIEEIEPDGIREVVDCPLCGGARRTPATHAIPDGECHELSPPWSEMRFQMVRCDDCGTHYQRVRPKRSDIGAFYGAEYDCYESLVERGAIVRNLAQLTARRLVRRVEALRPRTCDVFLDFGCGSGTWMELLRSVDAPWEMVGTEIDARLIDQVKALGFRGYVCDDSNVEQFVEPESVAVVHMNHVIEHVQSPVELLRKLREILVPGGLIVGQTPDQDCLERRLFGDHWVQWHLPRHLVIFDKDTMRKHADAAGLEVVDLASSPSGAVMWGASTLKWWANRRRRPYRVTREPLHAPLMLLFAPLSTLQARFANTSHMDFFLRRPA